MRIVFIESYRNICHFLLGIVEKIRIENFHSTFFTLTLARGRGSHPFSSNSNHHFHPIFLRGEKFIIPNLGDNHNQKNYSIPLTISSELLRFRSRECPNLDHEYPPVSVRFFLRFGPSL